jgi:hypothetical protein
MRTNINNLDRTIRFIFFIVSIALFVMDIIAGWPAYLLITLGTIFMVTSLMSFCPIYKVLGISSLKRTKNQPRQ